MNDTTPPQSSIDPRIQAHRAEKALRGAALARQFRDEDLAAIGLPPGAVAAIAPNNQFAVSATRLTAEVLYALAARANLAQAVERLFLAMTGTVRVEHQGHVFRAPYLARAELARRVLDFATSDQATPRDVLALLTAMRPHQRQRAHLLGLWIAEGLEDAGLVNAARELLARHLEAANDGEAHSDAEPSQQTRTTQPRRL